MNEKLREVVIIPSDEKGYGLIVSGESPVVVQDVKEGGPAHQAGVQPGDCIVKVNGTPVAKFNHKEVVQIIKSSHTVRLMVCAGTVVPDGAGSEPGSSSVNSPTELLGMSSVLLRHKDKHNKITAPVPVNSEQQTLLEHNRYNMLNRMLEKQMKTRDNCLIELQKHPSKSLQKSLEKELDSINRQVSTIRAQLASMKDVEMLGCSARRSQGSSRSSFPCVSQSYHPYLNSSPPHSNASQLLNQPPLPPQTSKSFQKPPKQQSKGRHTRSASEIPPPLPARNNRGLFSQISAPNMPLPMFSSTTSDNNNPTDAETDDSSAQSVNKPPQPPKSKSFNCKSNSSLTPSPSSVSTMSAPPNLFPPPLPPRCQAFIREESSVPKTGNDSTNNNSNNNNNRPQHCRAKSSPENITSLSETTKLTTSDSMSELSSTCSLTASTLVENEPPGTPPPPYGGSSASIADNNNPHINPQAGEVEETHGGAMEANEEADANYSTIPEDSPSPSAQMTPTAMHWTQKNIMSMEEEDFADQEPQAVEGHGPFVSLSDLEKLPAYLAVFMNYVVSNCDPASIFFILITELYQSGSLKEMKKWAYEIHSCFLLPGCPLPLFTNLDVNHLKDIDETLKSEQPDHELEASLKKVFNKVRSRARGVISEQLADFRSMRTAGLGNIFGPADHILLESVNNKSKETAIVEDLLVPFLESVSSDDWKGDEALVMASSLATILWKWFNVKCPRALAIIDKCPLFVNNKDRPLRSKFFKGNKKQTVRDHCFNQLTYFNATFCSQCQDLIWGIAPQGYQCANCGMNIHKLCAKNVEETCVINKKSNKEKKLPSFLGKIKPEDKENKRKSTQMSGINLDKRRGTEDEYIVEILDKNHDTADGFADKSSLHSCRRSDSLAFSSSSQFHSLVYDGGDGNGGEQESNDVSSDLPHMHDSASSSRSNIQKKKSGNPINRSESYKDKHQRKRLRDDRRKHSDPSIPTSKSDVDVESGLHYAHSGSSSNSSLSQSLDSPSLSQEQVTLKAEENLLPPQVDIDSDIEAEIDLPDWASELTPEELSSISSRERKRQDTINELFHTEQTHVRVLKVICRLFYMPLKTSKLLTEHHLNLLFPNLETMLEYHSSFNEAMKRRRREMRIVTTVADILTNMFEGASGDRFEREAALFVRSQSVGLEGLKLSKKRDQKLASFLQERENHHLCRRLQLKDMLPAGFQRLSKYPLLLESLLSYTDLDKMPEEYSNISRCLERTKEILASVNAAVREAENMQRLLEIQKKLDQTMMTKSYHERIDSSLKPYMNGNLDLPRLKLVHEGPLTWRLKGQKNLDLHVLILEEIIVLLQKDNDKYILKNFSVTKASGKEDKFSHSAIIMFGQSFLYRDVATDKTAFFIITTLNSGAAQIYEFVCSSATERKTWFKHFSDTQASHVLQEEQKKRKQEESLEEQELSVQETEDVNESTQDSQDDSGGASEVPEPSPAETPVEEIPAPPPTDTDPDTPSSDASFSRKTESSTRRQQEVQIIQIVEETPLISPSEVTVSQGMVLSAQPVCTPIEHLRRKDMKIRQALEEKQHIIADILGIPREDFETVADMASDSTSSARKEAKELVLGALHQTSTLQQTLNEALSVRESDIVSAKASQDRGKVLPLYPTPMNKLMNIATSLSTQLNSLLNLVSERENERLRMRKELVSSREQIHLLHSIATDVTPAMRGNADTHDAASTASRSVEEELSHIMHEEALPLQNAVVKSMTESVTPTPNGETDPP